MTDTPVRYLSKAEAGHAATQRLYAAGAGGGAITAATGVPQGRVRAIRHAANAATMDEACRIVGYLDFLTELGDAVGFGDLTEALSWVESPVAPAEGGYVRPVDLLGEGDWGLVEELAAARTNPNATAALLDATGRTWRSEWEVFAGTDGYDSIRKRAS